jgi:hypothetical protein
MLDFQQFIGPVGGMLCIAWGMGALSGWAFRGKTAAELARIERESCEAQIAALKEDNLKLESRLAVLEARLIGGLQS